MSSVREGMKTMSVDRSSSVFYVASVAVFAFLLQCLWVWRYTMDDAFISFRYSKHIGDGIGPIWNLADAPGPVEGFTSFLHVWVLGFLRWVSDVDLILAGKLLGVAAVVTLAVAVVRRVRKAALDTFPALVALSFLLLPYAALNAVSGMETVLFMLLNWGAVVTALDLLEDSTPRSASVFVILGLLATLTRPEFAAPFLLLVAYVFWSRPVIRTSLLTTFVIFFVLPGLVVTGWRFQYYGDIVPHPFYVKQGGGVTQPGVIYVARFLLFCALPYFLVIAFGLPILWRRSRHLFVVVAIAAGVPLLYFVTTMPLMGWWYRLLFPQVPLLAFLAAVAIQNQKEFGDYPRRLVKLGASIVFLVLVLAHVPVIAWWLPAHYQHELRYRAVGERLRPFAAADRWLSYWDVGSLIYESEWNTIDVVGLNTRRDRIKSDCKMKTDLVLRKSHTAIKNPCEDLYELVADLPFLKLELDYKQHIHMQVFARKDIAYREELRRSLLRDWPAPYVHESRLNAYWIRFKPFFFQQP
jgi:arabinofuranosyltransferase